MDVREPQFNLLDESWLKVRTVEGKPAEVSLKQLLTNAQQYEDLRGENPAQDFAVLRLLLAVMHTVVSRTDDEGELCGERWLEDKDDAVTRWQTLWNDPEAWPVRALETYLEGCRERFWLFHEEYPFLQISEKLANDFIAGGGKEKVVIGGRKYEIAKGSRISAYKLNGDISESDNKVRLFASRNGSRKNALTYPEAARWILFLNGYDDCAVKPSALSKTKEKDKDAKSPGTGWLGKLGGLYAKGSNLRETLLLNLALFNPESGEIWPENHPLWEQNRSFAERQLKPVPDNPAELLTWPSRFMRLIRVTDEPVVQYCRLVSGEFFEEVNAIQELMTVWKAVKDQPSDYRPKTHRRSESVWRSFSVLLPVASCGEKSREPGIVAWLRALNPRRQDISLCTVGVEYGGGAQKSSIDYIIADSLNMRLGLLQDSRKAESWRVRIQGEIDVCGKMASALWKLRKDIARVAGESDPNKLLLEIPKEDYYFKLDMHFRSWLAGIDPECDDMDETCRQWREQKAYALALRVAEAMVDDVDDSQFIGHIDSNENNDFCSVARSFDIFKKQLFLIKEGKDGKNA